MNTKIKSKETVGTIEVDCDFSPLLYHMFENSIMELSWSSACEKLCEDGCQKCLDARLKSASDALKELVETKPDFCKIQVIDGESCFCFTEIIADALNGTGEEVGLIFT